MGCNWIWAYREMKRARDKDLGRALKGNQSTYLRVSRVSPLDACWDSNEVVYALVFWGTEIVRYYPDGIVSVSLNGWNTLTTKQRVGEFSPLSLGTHKGLVYANTSRGSWVGSEDTWFRARDGELVLPDGTPVPDTITATARAKVPKRRDTLSRPLHGDAFESPDGKWVVAALGDLSWCRLMLFPYFGDLPEDRSMCVTDKNITPRELPNSLELLAASHGEGSSDLTPINRFVWSVPAGG